LLKLAFEIYSKRVNERRRKRERARKRERETIRIILSYIIDNPSNMLEIPEDIRENNRNWYTKYW